jgi:hypothetical protein
MGNAKSLRILIALQMGNAKSLRILIALGTRDPAFNRIARTDAQRRWPEAGFREVLAAFQLHRGSSTSPESRTMWKDGVPILDAAFWAQRFSRPRRHQPVMKFQQPTPAFSSFNWLQ